LKNYISHIIAGIDPGLIWNIHVDAKLFVDQQKKKPIQLSLPNQSVSSCTLESNIINYNYFNNYISRIIAGIDSVPIWNVHVDAKLRWINKKGNQYC
jgi:hypothetical protein